jgi:hypothetical protein
MSNQLSPPSVSNAALSHPSGEGRAVQGSAGGGALLGWMS